MERGRSSTEFITKIHEEIRGYSSFGYQKLSDSTELISHLSWLGKLAWSFDIYSPVQDDELSELLKEMEVPEEYISFLKKNNGLSLFYGSISLGGYQNLKSSTRDWRHQPVHLRLYNVAQRSPLLDEGYFCIGVYRFDVSEIYICWDSREVVHASRRKAPMEILARWKDFEEFLSTEFNRLQKLADERGYIKDMSLTLPPRS